MKRVVPEELEKEQRRVRFRQGMDTALAWAAIKPQAQSERVNPFKMPQFPPQVLKALPDDVPKLAMDENIINVFDFAVVASGIIGQSFQEGLQFLGYPFLSELAQRPEYRIIVETISGEMCRKWIKFTATGDDSSVKAEKLKILEDRFKDLEVQKHFRQTANHDGYFGRAHLFIDLGVDESDREELRSPIGDGQNQISRAKVKQGSLKALRVVEPIWSYPTTYNSVNPLRADWYNPQHWFVMGTEVHVSRFLTFVGREVPDILKPAYSFGGLSLSQMAKPYVDIWIRTRQSVADLIHSFVVWGLKSNLSESLMLQGEELFKRLELFTRMRDNRNVMLVDKETEEFFNTVAPLGSLDALQAQAQEHMMSVARIPAVKFTGLQPTGLNASSEGEIRAFYDTIHDRQETFFRPHLTRIMHFVMLDLWGEIDPEITFDFEPLWSMDEKEHAEVRKMDIEAAQILIDSGVVSQEEERARIADDPDTLYQGLDKEEMPDLKQEEEEGLVPEGGGRVTAELEKEEAGGEEPPDPRMSKEDDDDDGEDTELPSLPHGRPELQDKTRRDARTHQLVKLLDRLPPEEITALLDRFGPEQGHNYLRGLPKEAAE